MRDLLAGDGGDRVERQVCPLAGERVSLRVADEDLRQRSHLCWLALEARSLDPGVLAFRLPVGEVGNGLALPRLQGCVALVVGVRNIFHNAFAEDASAAEWNACCVARLPPWM